MTKVNLLEKKPQALHRGGSIVIDRVANFHHAVKRVQKKIDSDVQPKYLFDLMGQYNIFRALSWN